MCVCVCIDYCQWYNYPRITVLHPSFHPLLQTKKTKNKKESLTSYGGTFYFGWKMLCIMFKNLVFSSLAVPIKSMKKYVWNGRQEPLCFCFKHKFHHNGHCLIGWYEIHVFQVHLKSLYFVLTSGSLLSFRTLLRLVVSTHLFFKL